ncbi:LysR family transcriptional regulator [Herbaspirillum sp. SJZ107]|uniref:LysR family transcriptional regulator n=1 Tax=Herbaspirillum sp. SJZ107 TaxID=2572881 RepID=UPI0011684D23|nr:LysR family transcriptional regulator [Herbaspirillum sp. SJZ107]TQK03479.1 DNA-binding transcriptional LysR family regulator [Herbaspirillum sp. SJZ107]
MPKKASHDDAIDYSAWKLFIVVSELGSLSKAATAYGTTQPHISRQIGELERECGGRLFVRTGRGVTLTELGRRIAPRIRGWIADTDQLTNDIRATAGTPVGTVRIGILPSTAHPMASTLFYRLKERYPLIQLMLREGQGAQLETWLESGDVDLAILYRHSPVPNHGDIYLTQVPTYLVGPEGDGLTRNAVVPFKALNGLPLVMFCRPSSWRDQLDQLAKEHGLALNVAAEVDSLALQTRIVSNGGMYALLGPYAIAGASKSVPLQSAAIVEPQLSRYIALAISQHGPLTLAGRTVKQLIQDVAKEMTEGPLTVPIG